MAINMTLDNIHPTTASCLEILQHLKEDHTFSSILDIGCGDGILSFFAAALWPDCRIMAADISDAALKKADKSSHQQHLSNRIRFIRSDCFSAHEIKDHAPYDLIICNLLAEPIMAMRDDMSANLAPAGMLLCSGMLAWLADPVSECYQSSGFTLRKRHVRNPWHSLLLQKN